MQGLIGSIGLPAILSKAKTGITEGYKNPRQCQFSFINMTLR